jgi:acylphosphatase
MQLTGWVRNCFDGTVEALVVTSPANHERLLMALEQGPRLSRVDRVDVIDEPGQAPALAGFEVRNDA